MGAEGVLGINALTGLLTDRSEQHHGEAAPNERHDEDHRDRDDQLHSLEH